MKSFLSHINKLHFTKVIGQHRLFTSLLKLKETGMKLDRQPSFNLHKLGGASLLTAIGLLIAPASAQAAPVDLLFSTPTCVGNPTATTTTASCLVLGSKWRFSNVVIGGVAGSTQRDAIVTIVSSVGGATVTNMNTGGTFQNINFQPTVRVPSVASSTAYVVFNIEFVTPGNSTAVTIGGEVYETAFDVDGIGTVNNIREFVEFGTPLSTYLASPTALVLDPVPFTTSGVRYIVNNSTSFFNGITNDPVYEATALYPATTSSFNLVLGAKNGTVACTACDRQSSISFKVSDIVPINDLFITKSHTGNFTVGIPASYTVTVGNTGAATSGNIVIRDPLPTGLTIPNGSVAITGSNASAWTCTATSNVITCTSSTPIVAKGSSTFNITGIAVGSAAAPSVSNTATITTGGGSVTINDASTDIATVIIPTFSVSGTVFNDANGGTINGTGTNASSTTLTAYLVSTGTTPVTIAKATVGSTGIYSFPPVIAGNYTVRLSNDATGALNVAPPAASLPINYVNTGEGVGATPTTADTTADGSTAITVGTANLANVNFGIDRLPDTTNLTPASQLNPGLAVRVTVPTLAGTDPEDGALGTGQSFKIVTLPTNGTLYYPNALNVPVAVTAGQVIINYDPTKLQLDPNDGAITVTFTYAAIDAAGKEDPTPATVTMPFTAPVTVISITGTVWNDKDNTGAVSPFTNIQTAGELGTNAVFGTTTTPVNVILVNTVTNLVIDSQVVPSTGIYTFNNVPTGIGLQVIISPTAGTLLTAPPTGAAPVEWVKTAPIAVAVPASITAVSGVDFGIRQKAKLVLVKRITKIDSTVFTDITTDTWNPGVANWPANYLVGKVNVGLVKPGQTIEYTIYFLNNQGADATGVKICDPIRGQQSYVADSMKLLPGGANTLISLTDATDGIDRANSYPATAVPADCNINLSTATGAAKIGSAISGVAIQINGPDLLAIPAATAAGTPVNSYGSFKFTTRVDP